MKCFSHCAIRIVAAASTRPAGRAPIPQEWFGLALRLVGLELLGGPSLSAACRKTSHVATYAYVNPIVALLLGASIGHEVITPLMLIAGAVTLLGVVLVVMPTPGADRT